MISEFKENCCDDGNNATLDFLDNESRKCIHKPKTGGLMINEDLSTLDNWKNN